MSSFRPICIAALTVAVAGFVANAAAAQSVIVIDQSGRPYLAGLHPPPEQRKPPQAKTSRANAQLKTTTKSAQTATKRRPIVTAKSKVHRPARLAERIDSRVAWPSAEPAATDERASSQTVLQFAPEDTEPAPAATARPTVSASAPSPARIAPPEKIAATNERNSVDPTPVDPPPASMPVQTERFEASATSQMRVIVPAPIETHVTASTPQDQPPARSSSSTAQMLATLAGAITAGIVGWLIFGFGSFRTIKSRQT